jgi:imidazolonepropionase-like amidohydrolase
VAFLHIIDGTYLKQMLGVADGVDELRKQVRYNIKFGADVIKFGASAGVAYRRRKRRRPAVYPGRNECYS